MRQITNTVYCPFHPCPKPIPGSKLLDLSILNKILRVLNLAAIMIYFFLFHKEIVAHEKRNNKLLHRSYINNISGKEQLLLVLAVKMCICVKGFYKKRKQTSIFDLLSNFLTTVKNQLPLTGGAAFHDTLTSGPTIQNN